jgi:hypothetical protein
MILAAFLIWAWRQMERVIFDTVAATGRSRFQAQSGGLQGLG